MTRPLVCRSPFTHLPETREYPCGHQYDVLPCGCIGADDHEDEPCDGVAIAELEEVR